MEAPDMQGGWSYSLLSALNRGSQVMDMKALCSDWHRSEWSFPRTDALSHIDITQSDKDM